jgi:translin
MIPGIDDITKELMELQKRQDRVMELSRSIIRLTGYAITSIHNRDFASSDASMKELRSLIKELSDSERGFEYYSQQAHQEYVELLAFFSIIKGGSIPSMREMGETAVPYMLGIMDVVGELKREAYEALRSGDTKAATSYYEKMQGIYDATRHMRFAESLMPGFRKKQDVARILIESTGSDLLGAGKPRRSKK